MAFVFIPFIYFLWLLIHMYRKQRAFNVGSIVVMFYLVSALFSIIYVYTTDDYTYKSAGWDNMFPTILYCGLLTLCIMPIYKFGSNNIKNIMIKKEKKQWYFIICWGLIILTIVSLIISLPSIISSLSSNLYEIRLNFTSTGTDVAYTRGGQAFYQYFLNMAISMSPILMMFFFYNTIYYNSKKIMNVALIIASLVQPISSFTLASRNQVIYWLMTFIALYITFRPQMNEKTKGIFRRVMFFIGGLAIAYLAAVTIARFTLANTSVGNVQSSLIAYIGFPYEQFCNIFNAYKFDGLTFDRTFPIITKYIFGHNFNLYEFRLMKSSQIGIFIGTFYTFLGDALVDFGRIGMIIYAILICFIELIAIKRDAINSISLSRMILFVLVLRIPLLGLFAYMYLTVGTSMMILLSLFIAIILSSKIVFIFRGNRR